MSAPILLTQASGGAPTCSGTNGSMAAIFDWGLVQNGWSIDFTSGNLRVYRPGTGNRFRFYLADDVSVSGDARRATIRGCENASSTSALVNPFPSVTQVIDTTSCMLKSTTAAATARNYFFLVGDTFFYFAVNIGGATNIWDFCGYGDAAPNYLGDPYATFCLSRASTSVAAVGNEWLTNAAAFGSTFVLHWCRDKTGRIKSSLGAVHGYGTSHGAGMGNAPTALAGLSAKIEIKRVSASDFGSVSTTPGLQYAVAERGDLPNIWTPIHNGRNTVNTGDVLQASAYNASSAFLAICAANATSSAFIIWETSNTFHRTT